MKAIWQNPFDDTIFQLIEILSEKDGNTTVVTKDGIVSIKSNRLITIPEFIEILEKEIKSE